jgi:hypothetical protein
VKSQSEMTLEDFEKSLGKSENGHESRRKRSRSRDREGHRRHHHSSRDHRSHREHSSSKREHKRRRYSDDEQEKDKSHRSKHAESSSKGRSKEPAEVEDEWVEKDAGPEGHLDDELEQAAEKSMGRSSWMQAPSTDVEYKQIKKKEEPKSKYTKATHQDYDNKIREQETSPMVEKPREIDYTFGDEGSQWRMKKLENAYRQAKETGKSIDEVALRVYGDLRDFDDAREEEQELDRKKTYGHGYKMPEKPTGHLHETRQQNVVPEPDQEYEVQARIEEPAPAALDQTELNRLKAKLMKAKLRKDPNVGKLEAEYNAAVTGSHTESSIVTLNAMDNRMLVGGRKGEVVHVDNKRGRERGTVVENDDMTIDDMVRQERRTRGQGEGVLLAERIAKDGKYTDNLDYMDENAEKLAKHVQKSDINLRNMAIEDFQKYNKILDSCQLCSHEDKGTGPAAPVVSLGTRVYITLPTEPEISNGGACIVPIQHYDNLLGCDEDEWEEIRNFMKSLTRMYHEQGREVIFYENAAAPHRKRHASMEVVPLPYSLGDTAPAFFREAILTSDDEWSQHKKIIDTLAKAKNGLGKSAFRKTLVKEMPYFHVWFTLDGGFAHIVENPDLWPKGDLFAREVIGGMLDVDAATIKRQGRWHRNDKRVEGFRKRWKKFDWTRVLTEEQSSLV